MAMAFRLLLRYLANFARWFQRPHGSRVAAIRNLQPHMRLKVCSSAHTLPRSERAEHLRSRKQVYEVKHPETKHGGDRNKQTAKSATCLKTPSFVDDTSEKTGLSERAVRKSLHRAEAIAPEVKEAIQEMPEIADTGAELDALAALPEDEQVRAVEGWDRSQRAKKSPRLAEPGAGGGAGLQAAVDSVVDGMKRSFD